MSKLALFAMIVATSACVTDDASTSTESAAVTRPDPCPVNTPTTLAPPADADLAFTLDAQGVQRYACVATASTGLYTWTFVAPAADLFADDPHGFEVHHFAGPSWIARDSSSVLGSKLAAATVDTTAIPWLLLTVANHGGANSKLTDITSIQRLSTTGGNAPATGCDADHVGMQTDVLYTARYFFYRTDATANHRVRCGG
jgi:hypothetical protein